MAITETAIHSRIQSLYKGAIVSESTTVTNNANHKHQKITFSHQKQPNCFPQLHATVISRLDTMFISRKTPSEYLAITLAPQLTHGGGSTPTAKAHSRPTGMKELASNCGNTNVDLKNCSLGLKWALTFVEKLPPNPEKAKAEKSVHKK
jgi:hypothetical protein